MIELRACIPTWAPDPRFATGLLSDVTRTLSDQHVNILSATVTTTRDRVAFSKFTFEMGDPKHLGHVLRAVRNIDAVYDVYRVTN